MKNEVFGACLTLLFSALRDVLEELDAVAFKTSLQELNDFKTENLNKRLRLTQRPPLYDEEDFEEMRRLLTYAYTVCEMMQRELQRGEDENDSEE